MAKVTVKIEHVSWRAGRPRFQPGPKLRALGFKGEDLRHPEKGPWFSVDEASRWIDAKRAEIEAAIAVASGRQAKGKAGGTKPAPKRAPVYTIDDLFQDWFASPRFAGKEIVDGRRKLKALSPATIADYRKKQKALEKYDPELVGSAVAALDQPIVYGLYEDLWRDKGLHMARAIVAVLSAAISWGMKRGKVKIQVNPAMRLGMEMPDPRIRTGEPSEMRALVAAADAIGRPEIGDAIMLGLWTGQRQADRLYLVDVGLVEGRRLFEQQKTKARVAIREVDELAARLEAMRARRKAAGFVHSLLVADETALEAFKPDWYRHVFAEARTAAVAGIWHDGAGKRHIGLGEADRGRNDVVWILPPTPSLADFRDQDLRDTAVTWMARAGATLPEICQVTGHALDSADQILKHYLVGHPELADSAMAKTSAWYRGQQKTA